MCSQARTFNVKIALISFVQFSKIASSLRSDAIFNKIMSSLRSDIILKHPWESDRIMPGIVIVPGNEIYMNEAIIPIYIYIYMCVCVDHSLSRKIAHVSLDHLL